jgi:ATP-dependent DNA helicase RecG
MCSSSDGFVIAEKDLKMRGPGEFFGTRQHGIDDLKVGSLTEDQPILEKARKEAADLISIVNWEEKYKNLKKIISQIELKI